MANGGGALVGEWGWRMKRDPLALGSAGIVSLGSVSSAITVVLGRVAVVLGRVAVVLGRVTVAHFNYCC